MTTSRRLADRKVERFEKNIKKRGAVPETTTKKGSSYPVGPVVLGLFIFVVIGSSEMDSGGWMGGLYGWLLEARKAELDTIFVGVELARAQGWRNVAVETDSLMASSQVTRQNNEERPLGSIIKCLTDPSGCFSCPNPCLVTENKNVVTKNNDSPPPPPPTVAM